MSVLACERRERKWMHFSRGGRIESEEKIARFSLGFGFEIVVVVFEPEARLNDSCTSGSRWIEIKTSDRVPSYNIIILHCDLVFYRNTLEFFLFEFHRFISDFGRLVGVPINGKILIRPVPTEFCLVYIFGGSRKTLFAKISNRLMHSIDLEIVGELRADQKGMFDLEWECWEWAEIGKLSFKVVRWF